MKISVIVPTYKPQAYLWDCLDSLAVQTFPKDDFEVLLVLNGCCEPYNAQIKEWLLKHGDLQVRYIQTDVDGVSNARNIALDNAVGEYVAFVDDDDYVSEKYLSGLYAKASPDTISLSYPYAFNDGKSEVQLPYRITEAYEYCVRNGCNSISSRARKFFSGPCMKLIPMSFIQGRRFDILFKNGEDSLFMFLISDKFKFVDFADRDSIYYRRYREHSAVMTYRPLKERLENSSRMIRSYFQIFMKNPCQYSFLFFITRILGAIRK